MKDAYISLQLFKNRLGLISSFETKVACNFDIDELNAEEVNGFYEQIGLNEVLNKLECDK
ncbi:hypothetical protein LI82_10920 [Methanococcoides methylutens]|uniref:Uncharacterized protein n=1 Tax=Methanococcoides methylutens TaxID=2226 RepID=A0A099T249_METMT|nr:hypothetical protein [Methanococcoides methylutens]KGK98223.1 hypothetical protein LI82_10920 [Methanococcoides methylutens]